MKPTIGDGKTYKNFPVQITGIQSTGQRIIVTDSQESVHFVRYRKAVRGFCDGDELVQFGSAAMRELFQENQLVIFCDDTTPRYVTTCCVLDYNTVAVGDKFGSVSIDRKTDLKHTSGLVGWKLGNNEKQCLEIVAKSLPEVQN
ncbi:hypothetical protein ANCCEY_04757 [Ancylostoma ceylanicum]|uniref:RSE1/DDB1/CPSF1 C-terminal domain-containing protein n=1 Tax=Ancylostoma ceylanicum TaxID=53326 RepID=A0A0D6M1D2_9BILA|nr:hypothetical protein ANCCEY_04757 [Ancylostoma ceylanicum]